MSAVRSVYKVIRSVLFAAVGTVAIVFVLLYLALSLPWSTDRIRLYAEKELSELFKAPVRIDEAEISPFNEVRLSGVEIRTPEGEPCVYVQRIGAGIGFWRLLLRQEIEITYAELIGLDGKVVQKDKDGPLNIQFIIDVFKPKNDGAPPTQFDLRLRNIVIRKSALTFDRTWKTVKPDGSFDVDHIALDDIRADIAIPRLSNDNYEVQLRRLSFVEKSGLYVDALTLNAVLTPERIAISDFSLKLNRTELTLNDLDIKIEGFASIPEHLKDNDFNLHARIDKFSPDELSFLVPKLRLLGGTYDMTADLSGHLSDMTVRSLDIRDKDNKLSLSLSGDIVSLPDWRKIGVNLSKFELDCDASRLTEILSVIPGIPDNVFAIAERTGFVNVDVTGSFSFSEGRASMNGGIACLPGNLDFDGTLDWNIGLNGQISAHSEGFELAALLPDQPVERLALDLEGDFSVSGKDLNGNAEVDLPLLYVGGNEFSNIFLTARKQNKDIEGHFRSDCPIASADIEARCVLDREKSQWWADGTIDQINTAALGLKGKYEGIFKVGSLHASAVGNSPDNIAGDLYMNNTVLEPFHGEKLALGQLSIVANGDNDYRVVDIASDILDGSAEGSFRFKDIPLMVSDILAYALPAYVKKPFSAPAHSESMKFKFNLRPNTDIYDALNLNFKPMEDVVLSGELTNDSLSAKVKAPYLLKGGKKLIKNTDIDIVASREGGVVLKGGGELQQKKGYLKADISASALADNVGAKLSWLFDHNNDRGTLNVGMIIDRDAGNRPLLRFKIDPSEVTINGASWEMARSTAMFSERILSVDSLSLRHGRQHITVNGRASASPADTLRATLNDIDLSYIFNTLNINYVTFGGYATGKAVVSQLFTKQPLASTEGLHITDFSYNNAVLGDADVMGYWNNSEKAVGLKADIRNSENLLTRVDGDIFVTRDSLSLDFDANKINLSLIQPFIANILEDVQGKATGRLKLYGTFKNIAFVGRAFADTASVRIGYTNVTYHGSDSIMFYLDRIHIPGFRVYDKYDKSAVFSGDIRHHYFHNAMVDLNIRDVDRMLCYDTDSKMNPIWWGRIFANGYGRISGRPGYTLISFNATSAPNSSFTFSLDETETASEYNFLTFTDKRKSEMEIFGTETLEERFANAGKDEDNTSSSVFELDMSVAVNPGIRMNIIMDPSAGDKISAVGDGAMRINYNSFRDKLNVFGRYEISDGSYRFSFQDIILRDFKLKPGSSVSFNGDPMEADLDLTAGYRVNTNLTDLDKSFATDRELNRSSVPVEALLKVSGSLTHPDIGFDLALPTMTADVERKVRSIVSSEEMMNQQVLYLLALNRFYTPQFSGGSDGELVSVASSTLSSQVANVLSQITDKVSLNPSFKSDRNDFSDMEVDLALSSQLFDNRLIINGNLGYRDRSISQSTFIGDFDLEYLLSKDGRLRLKAYNHFNDAYYYLKSALTTQGIGVVYRTDFDDPFAFLKHRRRKKFIVSPVPADSLDVKKEKK